MEVGDGGTNLLHRPPHAPTAQERASQSSPSGANVTDKNPPLVLYRIAQPVLYHQCYRAIAFDECRNLLDTDPDIVPRMDSREMAQTAA
jgi:hypothetical protein